MASFLSLLVEHCLSKRTQTVIVAKMFLKTSQELEHKLETNDIRMIKNEGRKNHQD